MSKIKKVPHARAWVNPQKFYKYIEEICIIVISLKCIVGIGIKEIKSGRNLVKALRNP